MTLLNDIHRFCKFQAKLLSTFRWVCAVCPCASCASLRVCESVECVQVDVEERECVCVIGRERERERVSVIGRERDRERECVCV